MVFHAFCLLIIGIYFVPFLSLWVSRRINLCADGNSTPKPKRLKSDEEKRGFIPKERNCYDDIVNLIFPCGLMDVDQVEDHSEAFADAEKKGVDNKGKAKMCTDEKWMEDAVAASLVETITPVKSSGSGSINSDNLKCSNSDLSYRDSDEDMDDLGDDYEDNGSEYDYDGDLLFEDDYLAIQSQFDNVDIPTGVEVSIPWLQEPASVGSTPHINGSSSTHGSENQNGSTSDNLEKKEAPASSSSLTLPKGQESLETGVVGNLQQFDVVNDISDHFYKHVKGEKQPKEWAKRIQDEWKILEKDLPETIMVRVYEERMDLLRAVIVGPSGTPYHDGLFIFDCVFPAKYPDEPPMVYYYSGGLRLNPNLYENGKVCLSLLGTWHGTQTENWVPKKSTMLQVLVSIQALILNAEPYYNEPGYSDSYGTAESQGRSNSYSETAFILSLKTMVYTLRRPPKHVEVFVMDHFKKCANDILIACKAYKEGAKVATVVLKGGVPDSEKIQRSCTENFRQSVGRMMPALVREFSRCGFTISDEFKGSSS